MLKKQAALLEGELLKFGIALPTPYPEVVPTPETTEQLGDKFVYNIIVNGMTDAMTLHAIAIKEGVTNDRLRRLFKQLVFDKLDMVANLIKYGKLKGWQLHPPNFKIGG